MDPASQRQWIISGLHLVSCFVAARLTGAETSVALSAGFAAALTVVVTQMGLGMWWGYSDKKASLLAAAASSPAGGWGMRDPNAPVPLSCEGCRKTFSQGELSMVTFRLCGGCAAVNVLTHGAGVLTIEDMPRDYVVLGIKRAAALIAAEVVEWGASGGWTGEGRAEVAAILNPMGIHYVDDMTGQWMVTP